MNPALFGFRLSPTVGKERLARVAARSGVLGARLLGASLATLFVAACSAPTPLPTPLPSPTADVALTAQADATWAATAGPVEPIEVTLGLPYQPDVQFAPIYVALERGAWTNRGLDVRVEYGDETDFLRRVAGHEMFAVVAGGDQVLLARDQGLPVKYVATWHHRFPVAVFGLDPELDSPEDLVGVKVGVPMLGGVTALGLRALLARAGIAETEVPTEVVGFSQIQSLLSGRVDAAVGYAVNEPVVLRADGHDVGVIEVADTVNLVANGLVVSEASLADRDDMVGRLVAGFLDGIAYTLSNPDEGFATALRAVPEAADPARVGTARQVFDESLRFWTPKPPAASGTAATKALPTSGLGAIDLAQWEESADIMYDLGLVQSEPAARDAVDGRYVERYGEGS